MQGMTARRMACEAELANHPGPLFRIHDNARRGPSSQRTSGAAAVSSGMAAQSASETFHPLRDKPTRVVYPPAHPIADRVSTKQREVQAMADGRHDFAAELA